MSDPPWTLVYGGLVLLIVGGWIEYERRVGVLTYGEATQVIVAVGVVLLWAAAVSYFVRPYERLTSAIRSKRGEA